MSEKLKNFFAPIPQVKTMTKPETVQEFFTDESKWCQGFDGHINSRCCLRGALRQIYGYHTGAWNAPDRYTEAKNKVIKAIARKTKKGVKNTSITDWNDKKHRKFSDIVEIVKAANV